MDSVGIAINGKAYDADHKYQEKILAKNLYLNQSMQDISKKLKNTCTRSKLCLKLVQLMTSALSQFIKESLSFKILID